MSTDWAWLIELDGLTFGKCANGELKTVTFSDPTAMRFKQQGDAEMEMRQLEARFSWMKGRLTVREHAFVNIPAETCAHDKYREHLMEQDRKRMTKTGNYQDPTPEMLSDPLWNAIWEEIKHWDINVPSEYVGYTGAIGNHATAIYRAIQGVINRG